MCNICSWVWFKPGNQLGLIHRPLCLNLTTVDSFFWWAEVKQCVSNESRWIQRQLSYYSASTFADTYSFLQAHYGMQNRPPPPTPWDEYKLKLRYSVARQCYLYLNVGFGLQRANFGKKRSQHLKSPQWNNGRIPAPQHRSCRYSQSKLEDGPAVEVQRWLLKGGKKNLISWWLTSSQQGQAKG